MAEKPPNKPRNLLRYYTHGAFWVSGISLAVFIATAFPYPRGNAQASLLDNKGQQAKILENTQLSDLSQFALLISALSGLLAFTMGNYIPGNKSLKLIKKYKFEYFFLKEMKFELDKLCSDHEQEIMRFIQLYETLYTESENKYIKRHGKIELKADYFCNKCFPKLIHYIKITRHGTRDKESLYCYLDMVYNNLEKPTLGILTKYPE